MSRPTFSVRWDDAILLLLTCALSGIAATRPASARGTAAGAVLTTQAEVTYTDSDIKTLAAPPVTVMVGKASSVDISLAKLSDALPSTHAYACQITNTSNYANDFQVALTATGVSAALVRDENGDGIQQPNETRPVTDLPALTPDTPVACLLVVTPPATPGSLSGKVDVQVAAADQSTTGTATFTATYGRGLSPAFTFQADSALASSPMVWSGLALIGSESGVLYGVRTTGSDAGTVAWRYPYMGTLGAPIRGRVAADSTGYYFTANNGMAYHLAMNGGLFWKTQAAPAGTSMEAMPIVGDTTVSLACGDGRIRVLSKANGSVVMTSPAIGRGKLTTPALPRPGDMWVGGGDGALYNLNDIQGLAVMSVHSISGNPIEATPFADSSTGHLLTVTAEGSVYAMQMHSDEVIWGPVSLGSPVKASPWVDSGAGIVYFAGLDGTVHALSVADGSKVPGYPVKFQSVDAFQGSPVVDPLPGRPTLIAATASGHLYAMNAADPSVVAEFDTADPSAKFLGSPALSGATLDDVVVATATDGKLYGFSVRGMVGM